MGFLGTFTPKESSPAKTKAAPGHRLMEQTSLNPPTPSAGSSTSASASAVPFSVRGEARVGFVGNKVVRVGIFVSVWGVSSSLDTNGMAIWPVTLNLFQGLFFHSDSGRAARWTLNQVQGDA